jgi:hypothetical protein
MPSIFKSCLFSRLMLSYSVLYLTYLVTLAGESTSSLLNAQGDCWSSKVLKHSVHIKCFQLSIILHSNEIDRSRLCVFLEPFWFGVSCMP